jgi:hypothetical protein
VHLWKDRGPARRLVAVVLTFFAFSIRYFKVRQLPIAVSPAKPSFSPQRPRGAEISDFRDFPPVQLDSLAPFSNLRSLFARHAGGARRSFPEPRVWAIGSACRADLINKVRPTSAKQLARAVRLRGDVIPKTA